jgi:hypothetical protein
MWELFVKQTAFLNHDLCMLPFGPTEANRDTIVEHGRPNCELAW